MIYISDIYQANPGIITMTCYGCSVFLDGRAESTVGSDQGEEKGAA